MENLEKKYKKLNKIFIWLIPLFSFVWVIIVYNKVQDFLISENPQASPLWWHMAHYLIPDAGVIIFDAFIVFLIIRYFWGKAYTEKKIDYIIKAFLWASCVILVSCIYLSQGLKSEESINKKESYMLKERESSKIAYYKPALVAQEASEDEVEPLKTDYNESTLVVPIPSEDEAELSKIDYKEPNLIVQKASENEIYSVLQKMAQELGKDTPKKLDDMTTLSSISIEWRTTLSYNHVVTDEWWKIDDMQMINNELTLKSLVCNNFRTYIQYWVGVNYNFKNKEWKLLKNYKFDSSNCY